MTFVFFLEVDLLKSIRNVWISEKKSAGLAHMPHRAAKA
jgi:hypothetical protein